MIDADYMHQATELAREHGLATQLHGARLFNAAVVTDTSLATLCAPFDTVSLCFSKGLGAPMGSALVGLGLAAPAVERQYRLRWIVEFVEVGDQKEGVQQQVVGVLLYHQYHASQRLPGSRLVAQIMAPLAGRRRRLSGRPDKVGIGLGL